MADKTILYLDNYSLYLKKKKPQQYTMSSKTAENSSSEGSKTSEKGDNVSIVKKVEEYFYNSDDFAQIFEDFAIKNAPKVDLSTDECKLEYTTMYNEFHKLYEDALSEYIESQGFSVKDFYKEIRNAFNQDENSDVAYPCAFP